MCLTQPGQSCFDSNSPLDGLLDLGCATTKCIQSSGLESRTKDRPAQKSHFLAGCASWAKKIKHKLVVVVVVFVFVVVDVLLVVVVRRRDPIRRRGRFWRQEEGDYLPRF